MKKIDSVSKIPLFYMIVYQGGACNNKMQSDFEIKALVSPKMFFIIKEGEKKKKKEKKVCFQSQKG